MELKELDPHQCERWAFSNRADFEFGDIMSLANDIKTHGQIEPIIVREKHAELFEIIAGARRWKACLALSMPVKAQILTLTDSEALYYQLKENEKLPISDYAIGIHLSQVMATKNMGLQAVADLMGFSKSKLNNLLTFSKVPQKIWATVKDMSKVSSKSAEMIFRLSNKDDEHIHAILSIAEEIRKGAGAKKIETMVAKTIHGEPQIMAYQKAIEAKNGTIIGFWTKSGLEFSKNIVLDQGKLESSILDVYYSAQGAAS